MNAVALVEPMPIATMDELIARAKDLGRASKAASTRTAYASDWRESTRWCATRGEGRFPPNRKSLPYT